ncbi:MAG: F0F1 ATP synthase subunit B [SAR86 cluster bacterium]|uniref:ATP synthase subunit b n=1 Tax=SAR86 cluster bacterium TaxID=2030880 RepID=A0A2A4MQH4_9GAMM|nr:MAG: F0F1 ATP synthase subunit B [SAR86 cluster bacterium]
MNFNATIIGQSIAFAFFVWFCMKYVWPPIMAILEERQKKIADGLAAADRAQGDLKLVQNKVVKELGAAKEQAAGIIEQANKRATQIVEDSKDQAREEGERLLTLAKAEIEQESNRAKEHLRLEVAAIAIAGAEKILNNSVDQAANEDMLKQLAAEL